MAKPYQRKEEVLPLIAEAFRDLGYEGASLGEITRRTGLGKGSLYNFFPGGKEQMAAEVLASVDLWFVENVFLPLERDAPAEALARMGRAVDAYFRSGGRVCLVGAFALEETRDRFARAIASYFARWIAALSDCLQRASAPPPAAAAAAEEAVLAIQGALVLARALDDPAVFARSLASQMQRLEALATG